MTATTPAPPRRVAQAALVLLLVALALGGGLWLFLRVPAPAPRPAQGPYVIDEALEVPAAGVSRRLRVPAPLTMEIALAPPSGVAVRASLGPPQPVERSPVDAPDPEAAASWTARAGDAPRRMPVLAPGLYVLRLEPEDGAPAVRVALRVRFLPAR